jgi:hypothetical protein
LFLGWLLSFKGRFKGLENANIYTMLSTSVVTMLIFAPLGMSWVICGSILKYKISDRVKHPNPNGTVATLWRHCGGTAAALRRHSGGTVAAFWRHSQGTPAAFWRHCGGILETLSILMLVQFRLM